MSGTNVNNAQYNILIIDNNELDLLLLDVAVQQVIPKASVSTFFSSLEALDLLTKKQIFAGEDPHMLMISSNIERLDMMSTISLFMKNPGLQQMPVIVFNNDDKKIFPDELVRHGRFAFYKMPPDMDTLVKIVEEIKLKYLD